MILDLVMPSGWLLVGWIAGIVVTFVVAIISTELSIWVEENIRQPGDIAVVVCEALLILAGLLAALVGGTVLNSTSYDPIGISLCWFAGLELLRGIWFIIRMAIAPKREYRSRSELWWG